MPSRGLIASFRTLSFSAGGLVPVVIVLFIFLSISKDQFLTYSNIYSILFSLFIDALAIAGFTYVMVTGEIDLSVGSVYALAGTLVGWLLKKFGLDMYSAILLGLIAASCVGAINGLLVTRFKINSLMLTIGTMILVHGLVGVMATDLVGGTYPREFRMLARTRWFGINASIIVAALLLIIWMIIQKKSVLIHKLYLVGANEATSRIYGIKSDAIKVGAFIASSLFAGIGGVLTASRLTHADVNMGLGLEFTYVTAAILGGSSLYGGRGGVGGSILGLLFLALILNGFVLFRINPLAQQVVVGVLLIGAVMIDVLGKKRIS